jgi:predicted phage terminase large subunit-like protein
MPPESFEQLFDQAATTGRRELLRARFRFDLPGFCKWAWPERFDLPFNALHYSLFDVALERLGWDERNDVVRSAFAAPRGYAKSTISSFALLAHRIVYGLEAYIVLLAVEQSLSRRLSRELRGAFAPESRLAELYGPFEVSGGVDEWEVSVGGAPPVALLAKSQGSSVRGAKHPSRGIRPTLVLLDDVEHKDRVRNPDQRALTWSWVQSDVMKLGRRQGGTDVWWRGTILHPEAALARLMATPGWDAQRWRAIISWPERADLWARCGEIYCDLTLGAYRVPAAKAFYAANRAEMDRGVEVLDPTVEDVFRLYEQIWVEGLAAFLREKQNDPTDPAASLFLPEKFSRFRLEGDTLVSSRSGRRVKLADLRRYAHWDPSLGLPDGDFGAIAVVGRDVWGYCYVLDCWLARQKPTEQLAAIWRLAERWGLSVVSYEDNGFQSLVTESFPRQQEERRKNGEFWQLSMDGQTTSENKVGRIGALEPDVAAGWISFAEHLPADLLTQFAQFPAGDHDDGPDAVQRAWERSGGRPVAMSDEPLRRGP